LIKRGFGANWHIGLQVVILLLILLLPMHFYIGSEKENINLKDKEQLREYAQKVANAIYRFSNSNESEFFFPRSNIYKSAIYGIDKRAIFSLIKPTVSLDNLDSLNGYNYYILPLKDNVFDASYLLVVKKRSYSKLIVNIVAILLVTVALLFLAIYSIIRQSAKPYKELNLYLENFIKDAMHELKTPMGIMLLNLDGLSSIYKDNKMLLRTRSALKNMIVVYEDLEYFVRNRSHKSNAKVINLSQFAKERREFFNDLLVAKNIKIECSIQENVYIKISPLELSRIIDNTLSNAIKYSKSGTKIKLRVFKYKTKVYLYIKDEGRGIKDTQKIFDRYYRDDKISGGFGIGLNIVKKICKKNSIEIKVCSKVGRGSKFVYIFKSV